MSVLDPKKTYKNLKKKGFIDAVNKSDDHKRVEFFYNDKFVLATKISHGKKEIDDYLIKQMYTQCHLDKRDFMDLANCPLSQDEFVEILDKKGLLD